MTRNPLTMKLEQFTRFTEAERARLDALISGPVETYAPGDAILPQGQRVREIHLVMSGLAARSKTMANGTRQIMAFLVPGDLCDVEVFVLEAMDHDIVALSETTCALIPAAVIEHLLTEFSKLTQALWWSTMTDSAVLRERIIDHGRRDSRERIAHLFYEMLIRYRMIDETKGDSFGFPITQEDLADATGLTAVHVNRTLNQLREDGLVEFRNNRVTVMDSARLKKAARFEADYLHLSGAGRQSEAVLDRAGDLL
jgi:CRP-like cAMP-binding protein